MIGDEKIDPRHPRLLPIIPPPGPGWLDHATWGSPGNKATLATQNEAKLILNHPQIRQIVSYIENGQYMSIFYLLDDCITLHLPTFGVVHEP